MPTEEQQERLNTLHNLTVEALQRDLDEGLQALGRLRIFYEDLRRGLQKLQDLKTTQARKAHQEELGQE